MSDPDQMVHVAGIESRDGGRLPVHRDYDTIVIGAWRLDLDGIGLLQVALDQAVRAIRGYQQRMAADDA